jgi:predicted AAA+ superfamily ATPase
MDLINNKAIVRLIEIIYKNNFFSTIYIAIILVLLNKFQYFILDCLKYIYIIIKNFIQRNFYYTCEIKNKKIKKWIKFGLDTHVNHYPNNFKISIDNFTMKERKYIIKDKLLENKLNYIKFRNKYITIVNIDDMIQLKVFYRDIEKPKLFFKDFIEYCQEKYKEFRRTFNKKFDRIPYYEFNKMWKHVADIPKRSIKTLFGKQSKIIYEDIQNFLNNSDTYRKLEIPYKRGYLLYGVSGAGKTSTIKVIASEYNMSICKISSSLKEINDEILNKAFMTMPVNSIFVIEDFDIFLHKFTLIGDNISSSCLLNILDGISSTYDNIIFFTTNKINKIPKELIRVGRIDMIVKYDYITKNDIIEYFEHFFNNTNMASNFATKLIEKYNNISFAELQNYLIKYNKSDELALKNIIKFRKYTNVNKI